MRCPSCGATNRPDAAWCTLCLASFETASPTARVSAGDDGASGGTAESEASSPSLPTRESVSPDAGPDVPASLHDLSFLGVLAPDDDPGRAGGPGEVIEPGAAREPGAADDGAPPDELAPGERGWPCVACGHENPIALDTCGACGSPFAAQLRGRSGREASPRVTVGALVAGALLPGMGHVGVGAHASGVARVGLYLLWLLGGVALLGGGTAALPAAMPLLLGAFVVWAASLADLVALGNGGRQILQGRTLLWLVVGVLGLTLLGGVAALGAAVDAPV